jgi:hypothetical protein
MDDAIWDVTVFPRNRERLIVGEVSDEEFVQGLRVRKGVPHVGRVRTQPQVAELPDRRRTSRSELLREPAQTRVGGEGLRLGQTGPRIVATAHNLRRMQKLLSAG